MKQRICLLLATILLLLLCGCQGNFAAVDLQAPIAIPQEGAIEESVIRQIQQDRAIGRFTGESEGFSYEWKLFYSDITDPKSVCLQVALHKTSDGALGVMLTQTEPFGFSALLSVQLDEKWAAQRATAYANGQALADVSLTGSDRTVVNVTLDGSVKELVIRPDPTDESTTTAPTGTTTTTGGQDRYHTDPIPEGKPKPVEPDDQTVNKGRAYTCTFSIECSSILNNLGDLDPDKLETVPSDGVILKKTTVTFYEGESVFDVLQRVCQAQGIHLESSWTPMYNSAYIEGIHNLYEFDCGNLSGWMYRVNGWYPNYGCSRYQLKDGDTVEWRFTCDLGNDIGGGYAAGG